MAVTRNCEGTTRRDCLKLGIGGLFGATLAGALQGRAEAASVDAQTVHTPKSGKATNCILIWMDGGPTHFETFDPKPEAPSEYRGELGAIKTKVPGVVFSENMKNLAANLDKFAMIRSIKHNQGNHGAGNHYMMTGAPPRIPVGCGAFVSFHPSMGSVTAYELGKDNGLPPYFSMPNMSRSGGPNFLGAKYAPFVVKDDPNKDNFRVRDVALPRELTEDRFHKRTDLRQLVDKMKRFEEQVAGDPVLGLDEYYRQGHSLITSPEAQKAFDISQETDEVRDRYVRNGFGQRCLLARRLVEAGVPFVTIYDGGWDHHDSIFKRCNDRLPEWDQSVWTLISDLEERGLLDSTLVIAMGEFGRTPKISIIPGRTSAGRDHWANAMSVLMAGGGTPGGTVVGATDRKGFSAVERVLSPENLVSTIYTKLGINPDKVLYTPQGRPSHLVSDPTVIDELMG
ncbi:MAG: DUF1501 domain-containing protein [Planctomycetaceae bacterium]|nr:DUF1501 domain-containing protein [Planctomycetaceae bacterium]